MAEQRPPKPVPPDRSGTDAARRLGGRGKPGDVKDPGLRAGAPRRVARTPSSTLDPAAMPASTRADAPSRATSPGRVGPAAGRAPEPGPVPPRAPIDAPAPSPAEASPARPRPSAARAAAAPGLAGALRRRLSDAVAIRDPLGFAMLVSLLLHAVVMFMKFAPPLPIKVNPNDARLEVVLLNAQTATRPLTPEVLAQTNQEGGGDQERGRAKSPLPAELTARDGTALVEQRRRVERLEQQQRELLSLARGPQAYVSPERPADAPRTDANDREDLQSVITRMQAEIARNVEDYNKRPKRLTFGVNAVGVNYARYVADWATKIEKIGTERYPQEARGRQYDSLIITAEIDKHGNVIDVVINKKSKYEALNRVVKQIVYAGQPYERFPDEMARDGDILQIVRTWTFTNDGLETSSLRGSR